MAKVANLETPIGWLIDPRRTKRRLSRAKSINLFIHQLTGAEEDLGIL